MKKLFPLLVPLLISTSFFANAQVIPNGNDEYYSNVIFPADFKIGDYIEFLRVDPYDAEASGNYEISISYTKINIAAAATHLASITHWNPSIWREVGRINNNVYSNMDGFDFTVDCNTEYGNPRFRIRAVNVIGDPQPITINIKVRAINFNASWTPLNNTGRDLSIIGFLPMTNDWNLYVGNPYFPDGAKLAIHASSSGNVGIGIATPSEKLSVNGNIRAREIKVENSNWPDYVFTSSHRKPTLTELETFINQKQHLPDIPSAAEVKEKGLNLSEMNATLLKKIEELTLYIIEQDKRIQKLEQRGE